MKISAAVLAALFALNAWSAEVATSSPPATQAAREILQKGGNAYDAACAAFFALGVSQGYFTGIGSGGLAVIAKDGKTYFYDFREQAPASVTPKLFAKISPKDDRAWSKQNTGPASVGIPGNVAGCGAIHAKFGKLPWKELFGPAIRLANEGFEVSQMYSEELGDNWKRISGFKATHDTFKGQGGEGVKKGEILKQPALGKTLQTIAEKGPREFYDGDLAAAWVKEANALGVKMTARDLRSYPVKDGAPIAFSYGKHRGVTAAPPSAAGYMVAATLRFLDQYQSKHGVPKPESLERYVTEIEAFDHFGVLRDRNVSDSIRTKLFPAKYLGSKAEKSDWAAIEKKIAARLKKAGISPATKAAMIFRRPRERIASHTSNISVRDDAGQAIALTTSLGNIFGSGLTLPEHGFLLNSTMGDFDLVAGKINSPAAGRRPRSNTSPTILFENDAPVAILGAAGGPLIPWAVVQFAQNYYVHGMDAKAAVKFPRVSVGGGSVEIEKAAGEAMLSSLKKAGYDASATETIWGVLNAVVRKDAKASWEPVTEPRYDGETWSGKQL